MNLGYNKFLFILPFDHRGTFIKGMFNKEEKDLTREIEEEVRALKKIVYEGFKRAVLKSVPKEFAAILVDEQFGDGILKDARENGYITILTTEKSGQNEFELEYGEDFGQHIEKYSPTFVKVLVRFNPDDEKPGKERQKAKLKKLSDYSHEKDYKFMAEILIGPTDEQLLRYQGDKNRFDREERPSLAVRVMEEFQDFGIEPDVWKMEGMESSQDYEKLCETAKRKEREDVGVVILGRAAEKDQVERWIGVGAGVSGVIGFAVGRTVFWEALSDFINGKISEEQAAGKISDNYIYYYNLFKSYRGTL